MSDSTILDSEAIENLRALGDEMDDDDFLKEVIEIYLSDTPNRLKEIDDSLTSGDITRLNRAAHSIKGSSANLGAKKVIEVARRIEEKSKTSLASLEADIQELKTNFAEAKAALEAI